MLKLLLEDLGSICHSKGIVLLVSEALILSYQALEPFLSPSVSAIRLLDDNEHGGKTQRRLVTSNAAPAACERPMNLSCWTVVFSSLLYSFFVASTAEARSAIPSPIAFCNQGELSNISAISGQKVNVF